MNKKGWKAGGFLTLAEKLRLNVHDLNNEAIAGNVTDIRTISMIDERGEIREGTAVSGRMLKHAHYEYMRRQEMRNASPELCDECLRGEPMRPAEKPKKGEKLESYLQRTVKGCMIDDLHGFLAPEKKIEKVVPRRDSRVMFSWLLPTVDTLKQVVHARVSMKIPEEQKAQMLYYKGYASGLYSFVSCFDAERVGYIEYAKTQALDEKEWKRRVGVAIEAYRHMVTGGVGASLSHALAHANCEELTVAVSIDKPIPVITSPIYEGYLEQYSGILENIDAENVYVLFYSTSEERKEKIETLNKPFIQILPEIGGVFDKAKKYLLETGS